MLSNLEAEEAWNIFYIGKGLSQDMNSKEGRDFVALQLDGVSNKIILREKSRIQHRFQ